MFSLSEPTRWWATDDHILPLRVTAVFVKGAGPTVDYSTLVMRLVKEVLDGESGAIGRALP
jgi:hypothetical protein